MGTWEKRAQGKDHRLMLSWWKGSGDKKLQTVEMRQRRRKIQIQDAALLRNTAGYLVNEGVSWEDVGELLPPEGVLSWRGRVKNWCADCLSFKSLIESKFAAFPGCVIAKVARAFMCPAGADCSCHQPTMAGAKEGVSPSYLGKANKKDMLGEQSDCGGSHNFLTIRRVGLVCGIILAKKQLSDNSPWISRISPWFGPLE